MKYEEESQRKNVAEERMRELEMRHAEVNQQLNAFTMNVEEK